MGFWQTLLLSNWSWCCPVRRWTSLHQTREFVIPSSKFRAGKRQRERKDAMQGRKNVHPCEDPRDCSHLQASQGFSCTAGLPPASPSSKPNTFLYRDGRERGSSCKVNHMKLTAQWAAMHFFLAG